MRCTWISLSCCYPLLFSLISNLLFFIRFPNVCFMIMFMQRERERKMVWFGVFDCTHRQVGLSLLTCKLQVAGFGKSGLCSQGSSPLDSPSLVISLSPYYLLLFFIFFFLIILFFISIFLSLSLSFSLQKRDNPQRGGWAGSTLSIHSFSSQNCKQRICGGQVMESFHSMYGVCYVSSLDYICNCNGSTQCAPHPHSSQSDGPHTFHLITLLLIT